MTTSKARPYRRRQGCLYRIYPVRHLERLVSLLGSLVIRANWLFLDSGSLAERSNFAGRNPKVSDEGLLLLQARSMVRSAQDRRRVHCCHNVRRKQRRHELASLERYAELSSKQGLCSSRSQADDYLRVRCGNLSVQPWAARLNFGVARFFVDAAFACLVWHPTEVLHNICHIHLRPGDPCRLQGVIQNSACRADERMTGKIFLVARLLAYEQN